MGESVQQLIVALAVTCSVAYVMATRWPGGWRTLRSRVAVWALRAGAVRIARAIAPQAAAGACGSCDGCAR